MQVLFFLFILSSSFATDLNQQSVSTSTPTSSEQLDYTTLNSTAPLEFPAPNQNYPFVDNSSIRASLASYSGNDTEVDDLLGKDTTKENSEDYNSTVGILIPINNKPNPSEEDEDLKRKSDTEWIENGNDTEDKKFNNSTKRTTIFTKVAASTSDDKDENWSLFDGHVAAIFAGIFLLLSIFGYGGLLLWRRFLESKYGSREMLVNEDEFIDPDDMKHFSI